MTDKILEKHCEYFYGSTYYPLACFQAEGKCIKTFATYRNFEKVFTHNFKTKLLMETNPSLIQGMTGLYGAIRIKKTNQVVLIGPYLNRDISTDILSAIIHETALDWNEKEELSLFLSSIPKMSYNQFLNIITFLHFVLNKEEIHAGTHFKLMTPEKMETIGIRHTSNILAEEGQIHGTYNFEQQLLSYVRNGDIEGLQAFFTNIMKNISFTEGKLADNALRQQKNIFIGLICMVGKSGAIEGNLDIEQTYQLIDLYTQECERCQSVDEVWALRYNAILDFTRRVAEQKHPAAFSIECYSAIQYIKTHTNLPISIMDVVNHVGKSRSAFLLQFKKETGTTIAETIRQAKLQEAKLLLAYSDKSLSEISSFFYFSSQSHFQNLFKKEYGITPLEYRRRKQNR